LTPECHAVRIHNLNFLALLASSTLTLYACAPPPIQNGPVALPRPEGLSLASMAADLGLSGERVSSTHRYVFEGNGHSLVLVAGMDRALVDGRAIVLPFAPYYSGDALTVPASLAAELKQAVQTTIRLAPVNQEASADLGQVRLKTVVIDPGHGGPMPGTISHGGLEEKKVTLEIAKETARLLEAAGVRVIMTRTSDIDVDFSDRPRMANDAAADLFVSIHADAAAGNSSVTGVETFVMDQDSGRRTPGWRAEFMASHWSPGAFDGSASGARTHAGKVEAFRRIIEANRRRETRAAQAVQSALVDMLGETDRGVKRANFKVLRECAVPAMLVETGFLSNPETERRMRDPEHLKKIGRAIAIGIARYSRQ
jgi:N-acetylmuramoyl-L-alanine amidase